MSVFHRTKINRLLTSISVSGLIFSKWLGKNGYSAQLQKKYRDAGWLTGLCKGVMYRPGVQLLAYSAIASYNRQLDGQIRVAAISALEYAGFNHYVPMGKPILTVALKKGEHSPIWMESDIFDMTFRPYTINSIKAIATTKIEDSHGILYISAPEQAFLECLALAPKYYGYMDLYYIMEQLTTLRADVLQELLMHTSNNRIKRMFLYMAEKAGHYWFYELNLEAIDLGTSKQQIVYNGVYNAKYRITIPRELEEYEG